MQMLRILIRAKIGNHPASTILALYLCGHLAYDFKQTVDYLNAVSAKVRERRDVWFRDHNYVHRPVGPVW